VTGFERFNAEGPAGLIGRKPPGNRPKLDDAQRAALVRVVESGPNPVRDGVVRWRLIDLAAWVWDLIPSCNERDSLQLARPPPRLPAQPPILSYPIGKIGGPGGEAGREAANGHSQ
jgi:hypothetical protein